MTLPDFPVKSIHNNLAWPATADLFARTVNRCSLSGVNLKGAVASPLHGPAFASVNNVDSLGLLSRRGLCAGEAGADCIRRLLGLFGHDSDLAFLP